MKRFASITAILLLSYAASVNCAAREPFNRDSLAADFGRLITLLEETHPDPYSGFGGRYFFHKEASRIDNILRNEDAGVTGFLALATEFMANIQDEHTYIQGSSTDMKPAKGFAPIVARIIPEGLIMGAVPSGDERLLGSRIVAVEGMPVEDVLKKLASLTACENIYGAYQKLAFSIGNGELLSRIFPDLGKTVTLSLVIPGGGIEQISFPLVTISELRQMSVEYSPATEIIRDNGNISYGYAGTAENIMVLRIGSIMARENFRFMKDNGWNGLDEQLGHYYRNVMGKPVPEDIEEAIENTPSFSETFLAMLLEMKNNGTQTLVIDLTGNGGGWTPITLPSLYMMFGDDYLTTDMGIEFSRLVSPLLLKKQNMSLKEFNTQAGHEYSLGQFTMPEGKGSARKDIGDLRKEFITSAMTGTPAELQKQEGKPVYRPKNIYVVTDAGTFSAAFHYTFYLWKMGAVVSGVPSRQAPNTFMEATPFELPYTKLKGSISNSMQICFPGTDPRAKVFRPEMMPSYEDYMKYSFDLNAEILWLLDTIEK